MSFSKLLVANRGEIARRIFRACRELNIVAIGIYSEPDADAAWLDEADEIYPLHGISAAETYLNIEKILEIAETAGVEAIHPGYGFLSENEGFAAACSARGIKFVGPSPEAIRLMGSKAEARRIAADAGVPVTPGVDGQSMSSEALQKAAVDMGYPVMVKASAGGGGKGMRIVYREKDFLDALAAAKQEALSSFGDDHIVLERYLPEIHHIEVQILGDEHGHIVHLFERECSIQRRHQKIIEESPSPNLTPELREQICSAAVRLAAAVGYTSAGTVEFMMTPSGEFYLLEMNTRLQVEHPVTEWVTGIDLAQWQIRIAAGEPLGFKQSDLHQNGHAVECRLYAEDPARGFLPSIGQITRYDPPKGLGIRVDDGIASGSEVTPYYDPMLAKIITFGQDRPHALRRMALALAQTVVLGVTTNLDYLQAILAEPNFAAGETLTRYLEDYFVEWTGVPELSDDLLLALGAAETLFGEGRPRRTLTPTNGEIQDVWDLPTGWRNVKNSQ